MTTKTVTIEKPLYNGEVTVVFYPNCHRYKIKDVKGWLPSVTSITGVIDKSDILMKWALGLTETHLMNLLGQSDSVEISEVDIRQAIDAKTVVSDAALSIGTTVHEFAEAVALYKLGKAKKPDLPIGEKESNGAKAFLTWMIDNKVVFHDTEKFCYSKEHQFVGTVDVLFSMNDDPAVHIGDFKTSKGVYKDYMLQVAGYRIALEEEYGDDFGDNYIIRFDKETAKTELKRIPKEVYNSRDKEGFLAALKLKSTIKEIDAELRKEWKAKQK